jgi:thiol:disulfide interchange protein DsbC
MRTKLIFALVLSLAAAATLGSDGIDDERRAQIASRIQQRYPAIKVVEIVPGPIAGIYEVFTGEHVVYADAAGDFVFLGPLIDTATKEDVSARRLEERQSIDFSSLPLSKAIKVVKGDGSRPIAVFSDPDCPYCQDFERQLASIDNVTVYNFLYPIRDLHPQAEEKGRLIWCAKDPANAWNEWMKRQTLPSAGDCSNDPMADIRELGRSLKVTSTPTLFFKNGRRFAGTLPASNLNRMLDQNSGS